MARTNRDPSARRRIIDSACRTIAERGLRGATMRSIAADAGVSTGYVTHYFADKDDLATDVLAATNRRAGERAFAASRSARGIEAIAATVEAVLPIDEERCLEWGVWVSFWTEASTGTDGAGALHDASRALGDILAVPFAQSVEDGELPPGLDVSYETERLLIMAAGLGLRAKVTEPDTVRTLARHLLGDHIAQLRLRAPEPI